MPACDSDDWLFKVTIAKSDGPKHGPVRGAMCTFGYDSTAIVIHDTKLLHKRLMCGFSLLQDCDEPYPWSSILN